MDVIHLMFEEDSIPLFDQHAQVKSAVRTVIYEQMYHRKYKYQIRSEEDRRFVPDDADPMDVPPDTQKLKPYIPPTNPEDLPGILEGPLG
jgi:hypothetical protein